MPDDAKAILDELKTLIAELRHTSYWPHHSELKRLKEAAKEMTFFGCNGNPVSINSLDSWRRVGHRGIKLRCTPFMQSWYTCDKWIADFIKDVGRLTITKGCNSGKALVSVGDLGRQKRAENYAKKRANAGQ